MSKKKTAPDANQMSLLDLLRATSSIPKEHGEGALSLGGQLRVALSKALKDCPLDRFQVAGKMSSLLGREITRAQLDAWTAVCESHEGHRFPAEYLPAFRVATGSREPLRLLAEASGFYCLAGPDALRAEAQLLREKRRELDASIREHETLIQAMEKPHG